jgi:hypothetical protein
MAKKQELVLNPGKLSGVCGRLMCCLGYEIEQPKTERTPEEETIVLTDENLQEDGAPGKKPGREQAARQPEDRSVQKRESKQQQQPAAPETKRPHVKEKAHHLKRKDKGKPFSRRKKFFKKKRNK